MPHFHQWFASLEYQNIDEAKSQFCAPMVMMLCSNSVWFKIAFFLKFIFFRTTKTFAKAISRISKR